MGNRQTIRATLGKMAARDRLRNAARALGRDPDEVEQLVDRLAVESVLPWEIAADRVRGMLALTVNDEPLSLDTVERVVREAANRGR